MDSNQLIVIGIPARSYNTDLQLAVDMFCLIRPSGYDYAMCCVTGHDTPTARNEIVYRALKKDAKYIFFWDMDVSFTDCDAILSKFFAIMRSGC